MRTLFVAAAIAAATMVSGCSTIISGTSQKITITSEPSGADCTLTRDGLVIGRVNPTPGQTEVSTNRSPIAVNCKKDGYQDAAYENQAGFNPAVLGNVLLGGVVGIVVDASSGAASKYDGSVNVTLLPAATEPTSASTSAAAEPPSGVAPASAPLSTPSANAGEPGVPPASLAADRLRTLEQLYNAGEITRTEYERHRKEIVNGL